MTQTSLSEEAIFLAALEKPTRPERVAYIEEACAGNDALRRRVHELLASHDASRGPLDKPPVALGGTIDAVSERPGTQIGPYKLIEQIGEGGMGTVWMAQQSEPVKRLVAVKLIKAGMDSRQVIARFEAERQALALMDHPNIARVLDAGTTDVGRPYFVMDLVRGVPITRYCDEHHLTPNARLELFIPVCQAIQHAHQKGIIHRDLKPNNVLVALYDGKPVPKVIDFGVAKATGQSLTEKTLVTGFGSIVGTLEYMSPEQAEVNQLDIDTRSDIYSLGVLLYELLTGSTPFSRSELEKAGMLEMLRVIREEEPSKPSTKLSTAEGLPTLAANRGTEPAKLTKLVRGELDWIVMKALEKDRNRRYETANGFAADLQRYLADEAVLACPPSAAYRFRKFARRNRGRLATAAVLAAALLVAVSGIGWVVRDRSAREAEMARERADRIAEAAQQLAQRQAKVAGQVESILADVDRLMGEQKWPEALSSARRAESTLSAAEGTPEIQSRVRQALADLELVKRLDEIRMSSSTPWGWGKNKDWFSEQADRGYAAALRGAGIDIDALPVQETIDRIKSRPAIAAALLPALDDWVAVHSTLADQTAMRRLVAVLRGADSDPWRQRMRDALERRDWETMENLANSEDLNRQTAATLTFLSAALRENGKSQAEERVLRRAQWKHPDDFWINHRLGVYLIFGGSPGGIHEGIGYMRAAVAVWPQNDQAVMNLGNGYAYLGDYEQAIAHFLKALEMNPSNPVPYHNIALLRLSQGRYDEAIAAFDNALRLDLHPRGRRHAALSLILSSRPDEQRRDVRRAAELAGQAVEIDPQISDHWTALGVARFRQEQWTDARAALEKSLKLETFQGSGSEEALDCFVLAMCYERLAQHEDALFCYELGAVWMENYQRHTAALILPWRTEVPLLDLRAEAEALLGLPTGQPPPVAAKVTPAESPPVGTARQDAPANHRGQAAARYFARQAEKQVEHEVKSFTEAIELAPNRWEAWHDRAMFYFQRQRWEAAAADFSKGIELAPNVHTNWWHRGHAHLKLQKWDKAAADFGKVVEGWPDGGEGWYWRGLALVQMNQPDNAMADLRQAVAQGFYRLENMKNDPNFDPLRKRDDFGKLLEELAESERRQK